MEREQWESPYVIALRKRIEEARRLQEDLAKYQGWLDAEAKDCQVNFRIGKGDLMKLKSLAKAKHVRYQTCLREIVRRELILEEEYAAGILPRKSV
jgi:predicted DNA binding CopG/RHH family protein